jgi:hypothetical protein
MRNFILFLLLASLALLAAPPLYAQSPGQRVSHISYEEARPILAALRDIAPPELQAAGRRIWLPHGRNGWRHATPRFAHA